MTNGSLFGFISWMWLALGIFPLLICKPKMQRAFENPNRLKRYMAIFLSVALFTGPFGAALAGAQLIIIGLVEAIVYIVRLFED